MAYVALTDEQKEQLFDSERFRSLVDWSILNKARYWSQLNGTSVPGNDYIKWAKSRLFSTNNILNNLNNNSNDGNYKLFLILLTQQVYDNAGSFDENTVINYMLSEAIFETVTDTVFDEKIKTIIF